MTALILLNLLLKKKLCPFFIFDVNYVTNFWGLTFLAHNRVFVLNVF